MKRFAIALSIIVLLAMLSPCFSILAQPTHTPHQNPVTAKDSPVSVSLLLFYGNALDLAAIGQYQDAKSLLDELEYADIPDELRYIIDRFNSLSRQLFTTLDNLELLLDEASTLLAEYHISEAKQRLDDAETTIHSAQFLLEDIEAATNTLSSKVGVFDALAGSEITLAYERLDGILHRLRQLIDELNQLRQSLIEGYKIEVLEKIPTELSLSITPPSVFVGDSITASGRLTGDGSPMANRNLTLLLDNEPLVITTDLDGWYAANITIPYEYVSTMTLNAVYTPADDDIGTYLACKSPPVVVNTSFYSTLLEVSAPETGHLGLPITINGRISSTDGTVDRIIKVLFDNTQLAEKTVRGQFNVEITPPPQQISMGEHSLTVVATPQRRYSGASKSLTINISRLSMQADIQLPQLILVPKPIQVSGKVYHSLSPIQDAEVSLVFRGSTTIVRTSTDGSFSTTIEAPLDLSLIGPQELTITVEPVEPWYAPLQIKRWIFTINPATIGLMLISFTFLGVLVFTRVRARLVRPREEVVIPEAVVREPPTIAPSPRPKYEFTGIKGRILSAYLNGLEAIQKVTSITMAPHATLREFLKAATSQLPTAIKPFTELTTIAEITLYSAHELDEDIAARAEQLTAIIKEELHSGTS